MIHDLVFTGGAVATMDDALPRTDWVAITYGLVSAVGVGDAPEAHQVLDAAGGLILPGFNDAHCHTMWFGLSLAAVDCIAELEVLHTIVGGKATLLHGVVQG